MFNIVLRFTLFLYFGTGNRSYSGYLQRCKYSLGFIPFLHLGTINRSYYSDNSPALHV